MARSTDWIWVLGAVAAFMLGQSALLGASKKGGKIFKFPASFPDDWDGRTVSLKVGRKYRLPLPEPAEGAYWVLQITDGEASRSFRQAIADSSPKGWLAPDGMIFLWIEPTEDMQDAALQLQLWGDDGILKGFHEVNLTKR